MKTIRTNMSRTGKMLVALVVIGLIATGVSAGILSYVGKINITANVSQSVLLDGNDYTNPVTQTIDVVGGCSYCYDHTLTNNGCQDATVAFETTITGPGGSGGVTVEYIDSVHLENKDASWNIISGDGIEADVTFGLFGDDFCYDMTATGLTASTDYYLIYKTDNEDRFVDWADNADGTIIVAFTSDVNGDYEVSNCVSTGDISNVNDWNNAPPADYTQAPDYYLHKTGGKLWIVTAVDYNDATDFFVGWNPDNYLFETELVRYFDNDNQEVTIPAGEFIDFKMCIDFDQFIIPGTYNIQLKIVPVTP